MGQGGIVMVKAQLVESAAQHASAAVFQLWCRGHKGLQECQLRGFQMEGIRVGEKAFQLISRQYELARPALLHDWVFEDFGLPDIISLMQIYLPVLIQ